MRISIRSLLALPIIVGILFDAGAAWAQAAGRPRECFTKAEESAEQIVRLGLRLREGAKGCDEPPWNMQTQGIWEQLDSQFGARFAAQTAARRRAFQREFADAADNRLEMWNGRIVMHFRHYPLSEVYCGSIKDMMQKTLGKGWGVLQKNAVKGADEVKMDYRLCE